MQFLKCLSLFICGKKTFILFPIDSESIILGYCQELLGPKKEGLPIDLGGFIVVYY